MERIKELYIQYKEKILYLVFGGLTTLVSLVCIWIFEKQFNITGIASSIPSQIVAIIFAYITNKIWVFESKCNGFKDLMREIGSFFGARALTLILHNIIVFIFVDWLDFNNMLINLAATIITIILNYIFSKLFIFKKNK